MTIKHYAHSKQGWRVIGDTRKYYRSKWEANYSRYLNFLVENRRIQSYAHEPQTFWFEAIQRGVRSYLPDFRVIEKDGSRVWVEVKGYYDAKSLTKIKRFRKYYPEEILKLVDKKWFAANNVNMRILIKDWE